MPKPKRVRPVAQEIPEEMITEFHALTGKRIKYIRKLKGFRLDHFAYEVGVARNTLVGIEAGKPHTTEILVRIIYGLGTGVKDFFAEGFDTIEPEVKLPRPKT